MKSSCEATVHRRESRICYEVVITNNTSSATRLNGVYILSAENFASSDEVDRISQKVLSVTASNAPTG